MSVDFFKARTQSEFDISEKFREYAINDAWRSNTALWNLISAFSSDASSKIYERIVDMTKNISDVDICDIKHLESISYQFGLKSGYKFIDSLPSEVYDLMNMLSVKESSFFKKNGIFSESGIDTIIDSVPNSLQTMIDNNLKLLDVVVEYVDGITLEMYNNNRISNDQKNSIHNAVTTNKSLSIGLNTLSSHGTIDDDIAIDIKKYVISALLDNGKISYDDYKSYVIHGDSLKDTNGIYVKPAYDFKETINENNEIITVPLINHTISISRYPSGEFKIKLWHISRDKFISSIGNIANESVIRIIDECYSNVSQEDVFPVYKRSNYVIENLIKDELLPPETINDMIKAVSSIPYIEILEDAYSNGGMSELTEMSNLGIITDPDYLDDFAADISDNGFIKAYENASKTGKVHVTREKLEYFQSYFRYLFPYDQSEIQFAHGEMKLRNNSDSLLMFVSDSPDNSTGEWVIYKNYIGRYSSMKAVVSESHPDANCVVIYDHGSQTLNLPHHNLVSGSSMIGIRTRFNKIPHYVGVQSFINDIVYKSYYDLIKEKLSCVLNAGNESDLSVYEDGFLKYTDEYGFSQYVNDRNVNFDFYRAMVFSNFCSNFYKYQMLDGDWFLDSDLHTTRVDNETDRINSDSVIGEVARILSDMTLSIAIRREVIKKLAIQYSYIGSNYGVEKTIGDFILRNFTSRNKDWNFRSSIAVENDNKLPSLSDIKKKFKVEVVEYYDSTEYLNISADSPKQKILLDTPGTRTRIKSSINASGILVSSLDYIRYDRYEDTEYPMISGGNERFWELPDYSIKLSNESDDIIQFYKNVDGASEKLSSIDAISAFATTLWNSCAVSSLIDDNADMHNKYIGDGSGYMTAVNSGNENYPTIAPLPTLTNLTEIFGSMERDYQSVLNDDRPAIVEGVNANIAGAYRFLPVPEHLIGTEREIFGIPPFYTRSPEEYVRIIVDERLVDAVVPVERHVTINVPYTSSYTEVLSGYRSSSIEVPSSMVSNFMVDSETTTTEYIPYYNGERIYSDQNSNVLIHDSITQPDPSDPEEIIIVSSIDIDGTMRYHSNTHEHWLESVKITLSTTVSQDINDQIFIDQMLEYYNDYIENEDLNGASADLSGVSAEFDGLNSIINDINVPYYRNKAINSISGLSSYTPISQTQTYSYDPSEDYYGITYGQVVANLRQSLPSISSMFSTAEYNNIVAYTNAVIDGKIVSGSTIIKEYDGVAVGQLTITQENGHELIGLLYDEMVSITGYANYHDEIADIRADFRNSFNVATGKNYSGGYSTITNYNRYKQSVENAIAKAVELNEALIHEDNSEPVQITETKQLSAISNDVLISAFGIDDFNNRVNKAENKFKIDSVSANVTTVIQVPSAINIDIMVPSAISIYWQEERERTVNLTSSYISSYFVDEGTQYYETVSTQVTAYIEESINAVSGIETETNYLFDANGGLINSWRNINVELRGYQARYEASPNLTKNYVENKYVDVDGPWIGEALYDLIDHVTPMDAYGNSLPQASSLDAEKFVLDHRPVNGEVNRRGKWYIPQYVDYVNGHDTVNQLKLYISDIINCRNESIFEVEADSFGNQYTLYKDKSIGDKYDAEGVLWMRHANFPFSFPLMQPPRDGWEDSSTILSDDSITVGGVKYTIYSNESNDDGFRWYNQNALPQSVYTAERYPFVNSEAYNTSTVPKFRKLIEEVDLSTSYESVGMKTDQIYLGYTMNYHRSIFNRCLAFGINNTSLWAAGYDGKNSDGSDHFNIRIVQCGYFTMNNLNFYGNRNPRANNKFNSDPTGYNSNSIQTYISADEYKWLDFCGGYYDGNVINFVFYGNSGFRFRIYNLTTARLNNADIIAEFGNTINPNDYKPYINNGSPKNPFRLVEDNNYCYIGWITERNKFVVCQIDKTAYTFTSLLEWDIPSSETSKEIKAIVAGINVVKVMMKSGNVYYGRMNESGFMDNSNYKQLIPFESIGNEYVTDDDVKIPKIPLIDITQWRHWSYSLTTNSLYTISYSDVMNTGSFTDSKVSKTGTHYDIVSEKKYAPGNFMNQSVIAYDPYSGIKFEDTLGIIYDKKEKRYFYKEYRDNNGVMHVASYDKDTDTWAYSDVAMIPMENFYEMMMSMHQDKEYELTGYEIGNEFFELTPYLQSVIPAYAPSVSISRYIPSKGYKSGDMVVYNDAIFTAVGSVASGSVPTDAYGKTNAPHWVAMNEFEALSAYNVPASTITSYYGLPYNNLYVERTDYDNNAVTLIDSLNPRIQTNWLVLKNFYNYGYEHEYSWTPNSMVYDQSAVDKIVGWRKYNKCSISRYSDTMWMSYNFIRDYNVLMPTQDEENDSFNNQQAIAKIMNDYEFVEIIYGTIQLMNSNYCKSNVFSINIKESQLNRPVYPGESSDETEMRRNAMAQIKDQVREMIGNYAPIHTQLWKIEFNG